MLSPLRNSYPIRLCGILLSETILLFVCFLFAAYTHLGVDPKTYMDTERGAVRIAVVAIAFVVGAYITNPYVTARGKSILDLVTRVMSVMGGALIFEAIVGFMYLDWALPMSVVVTGTLTALPVLSAWRFIFSGTLTAPLAVQLLAVGNEGIAIPLTHAQASADSRSRTSAYQQTFTDAAVLSSVSLLYQAAVIALKVRSRISRTL
jgi:hypothetical protein